MSTYTGRSVQSRQEPIVYCCACGNRYAATVWRVVGVDEAGLRARLVEGDLNRVRCPSCARVADVDVSVLLHDPTANLLVCVAPSSDRHRELTLRSELYAALAADAVPPPGYVLQAHIVFGAAGLVELLAAQRVTPAVVVPAEPVTETVREHPTLVSIPPRIEAAPEPVAPAPTSRGVVEKPADVEITQSRAVMNVPDPRTAVIERWIAARESATALFVDERVVVCAALGAEILEQFVGRESKRVRITMRPQLHRMASYPILALTFVAGEDGERPDETRVIHVPLDLARAAHRVSIDQLQRRCAVELELFDREYLPVVSHALTVPLEAHVAYLFAEAKLALERLPVATRDFERAKVAFLNDRYDRLGRTVIDLPALEDVQRGTPSLVRNALGAVSRWSEQAAETYLLEIRGFPLTVWRRLATTTVQRSVELGLFVPRGLAERIARRAAEGENGLDLPPWSELIEIQIRHFAELSARLRPSDLTSSDEAANWEQLLREAERLELTIDAAVQRLADAAFSRAGGRPSRRPRRPDSSNRTGEREAVGAAPQLKTPFVSSADLLPLLEDRERRLDASVELASRKELPSLPALFVVLRRMSRAEASTLLPRLAAFGAPAERWLIEGLRSKKAFMRQGCALALGRLATPMAIDALVRLLFEEPTDIWSEIARAIGDIGGGALMPLAAGLREVKGDERDRAVHAFAHIAAHGAPTSRGAVEALATGRDALVANVARRALVLAPEVKTADEAVRTDRREQTLVRAFTRRFYDIAAGGDMTGDEIHELDWAELETVDELEMEPDIEPEAHEDDPRKGAGSDVEDATLTPGAKTSSITTPIIATVGPPPTPGSSVRRQTDPASLSSLPVSTLGRRPQ